MITIYYLCGGYALNNFNKLLKSVRQIFPNLKKRLIVITNDSQLNLYDEYVQDNVEVSIRIDNELCMIPLNKVNELQKFIDSNSKYSIFINPNAIFGNMTDESLLKDTLKFGYVKSETEMNFIGSFIYGPTEIFNKAIKFARDYEFVDDENRTDEQKLINFMKENDSLVEYKESSNYYKFI